MTPTAQAGWKSWYVPAPIVTFNARRIATQTSTDSYVCGTPFDSTRTWKMYSDCWVTCLTVETAMGKRCITSLTALSTVGHELKVSWAAGSCTSSEYHRTPPKISRRSVCHTGHIETNYRPETRLEKNLRLWPRGPHLTIHQYFGFLFFSAWSWNCAASFPVLLGSMMLYLHKSRASSPSIRNPASNEMISHSVEQWDTDVCFLHIQLMGTNVRLPKIHKIPPEVDVLSPQGRQQNLTLGINSIDNAESCFTHDNNVGSHLRDECMKSTELKRRSQALVLFWQIEHVCVMTMKCLVYQFVSSTNISRQFATILLTILQLIQAPPSWIDDHASKDLRLCITVLSFCSPVRNISQRIFEHVLPCRRTTQPSLREVFSHPGNFSVAPAEIRDSNISLYLSIIISFSLHSRWVHPKSTWSRNEVGSSRSTCSSNVFHMGAIFCFVPAILI